MKRANLSVVVYVVLVFLSGVLVGAVGFGLYNARAESPEKIPTYELYLIMRASNVLPVEEHTALVEKYLAAVAKEKRNKLDNARVVVTGAFCEQPPIALNEHLRSGCNSSFVKCFAAVSTATGSIIVISFILSHLFFFPIARFIYRFLSRRLG